MYDIIDFLKIYKLDFIAMGVYTALVFIAMFVKGLVKVYLELKYYERIDD